MTAIFIAMTIGAVVLFAAAMGPVWGQPGIGGRPENAAAAASEDGPNDGGGGGGQPQTAPGRSSAFEAIPVERKRQQRTRLGHRLLATLPNGLRVAVQEMPNTEVVSVRCYVGVGSMLEGEFLGAGISHYCEHLLAGGSTTTRPEAEIKKLLDTIGGQSNAYTTVDHTCYYITTTSPHAVTAIDIIADWMQRAAILPAEFEREKNVIIREVEKGRTEPNRMFHRLYTETEFRVHPYRVPVIGYPDLVRAVTRDDMIAFRDKHYHAGNAVIAIAGGISVQEALIAVHKHFGEWARKPQPAHHLPAEPEQMAPRLVAEPSPLLLGDVALVRIAFPTVPLNHEDLFALDLLAAILGHGEGSRLVKALRDQRQLVKGISASSWTPTWGRGAFSVMATTSYDKLGLARDAILSELMRCRDERVTQQELQRAITRALASEVYGRERAEDVASSLGFDVLMLDDPDFDENYLDRLQAVTADDIRRVAQRYFEPIRQTVVAMVAETAFAADATGNPWATRDSVATPAAAAVRPELGDARKFTLANGLRVILKPMPGTRNIALQFYGHGGLRYETPETNGWFFALPRVMVRGSANFSAEHITDTFDALGGGFGGVSGNNTVGFSARWIAKPEHADTALRVIADVLQRPAFAPDEVQKLRDRQLFAAQRQDESWQTETVRRLRAAMFAGHSYSMTGIGTADSIAAITPEALAALHRRFFRPNNFVLALAGDFDSAHVESLVRAHFGEWESAEIPALPAGPFVPPAEPKAVRFSTSKDMTAIALGYAAPPLSSPDRAVLDVIDAVTSGVSIPSGWLHDALRGGTNDYVYYIHALTLLGPDAGMFYVLTQCHPSQRETVLGIVRRELARIWTAEVQPEELAAAKRMCLIAHATGFQTTADWAGDMALSELYGLGYDHSQHYAAAIEAVTAADVVRVARQYFTHEILVEAMPTNPAAAAASANTPAPRQGE